MWPSSSSSWVCVSPHTCIRCARDNTAEDDSCVFNKFICLCDESNKDGQRVPCLHEEIIEEHKNKKFVEQKNSMPSVSGEETNVTTEVRRERKRRRKKNRKEYSRKLHTKEEEDCLLEARYLLPTQKERNTPNVYIVPDLRLSVNSNSTKENSGGSSNSNNNCSSSSNSSSSSSSSSSSTSTSTSISSSTSSSNIASSSNNSSSSSTSTSSSSCCSSTEESYRDECSPREVPKKYSRRGYQIMGSISDRKIDCDKKDRAMGLSESGSESSCDGDTTSVSSDDSWWRKYEQLKDMPFPRKGNNSTKDSGYVSTTSPNTESAKTDE